MQHYDPADSTDARYAFTFDVAGYVYARLLVEPGFRGLDLADLFNRPWEQYKVAGFSELYISRPDWSELGSVEIKQLDDDVSDDLRFDYSEDEVGFWFDDWSDKTFLLVHVYDVLDEQANQN